MTKSRLITLLCVSLFAVSATATIIHIPGNYSTIQAGINASSNGDTVLVQPGTYYQNIIFNGHHITLGSLFLTTGETSYISTTIIDGNHYDSVVRFQDNEDSTAIIIGFTLRNGGASDGGGINCLSSNPKILNNIITEDSAHWDGGGIYCIGNANPLIRENTISGNIARSGSGIYCSGSSPTIIGNNIVGNFVTNWGGGGIYCTQNSSAMISDNNISGNISSGEGGGILCSQSNVTIIGNLISENSATGGCGGGIYCSYGNPLIRNNTIYRNSISGSNRYGSGMYCNCASPYIIGNLFVENFTTGANCYGGAIYASSCNSLIYGNVMVRNSAQSGGAMEICYSNPLIIGNTITMNRANWGGALYIYRCDPCLTGNILWGDSAGSGPEIRLSDASPTFSYCNIQGGWEGEGNIDLDPLFRNPENDDFHLMAVECGDPFDSPCIDAASPHFLDSLLDCSWGLGTTVCDMGAYGGGNATGVVIEVPQDFSTIQEAIDHSYNGDTVLVSMGIYTENLNFRGRNIVLGSLFLTTGDSSHILSTIIEADTGSVVVFECGEDSIAEIAGFTIRNGLSSYGGGIYCDSAGPTIRNNLIMENTAMNSGGGIFCNHKANPIIRNNCFTYNESEWGGAIHCWQDCKPIIINNIFKENSAQHGGGILCNIYSHPAITNNLFIGNSAGIGGGGIYCWINSEAIITNNVFNRNAASSGGGLCCFISNPVITNNICWGDSASNGAEIFNNGGSPVVTYCDIQGGWQGMGNLNTDPLFRNPDISDYHLMAIDCGDLYDSPCIDIGSHGIVDWELDCQHGLGTILSDLGAYGGNNIGWTGVKKPTNDNQILPRSITLPQNYPNPFNETTIIRYELPNTQRVTLSVYNILGQQVVTLHNGLRPAGSNTAVWEASEVASGIYFVVLQGRNQTKCIKMILLK